MTSDLDRTPDSSTELCTNPASRPDRAPGMHWSLRADRRIAWIGTHWFELAPICGFTALSVFAHWAFALVATAVAVLWAVHEYRTRRRDKSTGARPGALTSDRSDGTHTATSDEEAARGSA